MNKAKHLIDIINTAGLSKVEICKRSGVALRTVAYWATFKYEPQPEKFRLVWSAVLELIAEQNEAMSKVSQQVNELAAVLAAEGE